MLLLAPYGHSAAKRGDEVFPCFPNLGMVVSLLRNSIACVWRTKRVGIMVIEIERMQIHFLSDVFFTAPSPSWLYRRSLFFSKIINRLATIK